MKPPDMTRAQMMNHLREVSQAALAAIKMLDMFRPDDAVKAIKSAHNALMPVVWVVTK